MQDYAFSIPEFKRIASSSSPSSSADGEAGAAAAGGSTPRLIAGVPSSDGLALASAEVKNAHALGGLEAWGKVLWWRGEEGGEGEGAEEGEEPAVGGEEEPGQGAYRLGRKFEGGAQGEIWRAYKVGGGAWGDWMVTGADGTTTSIDRSRPASNASARTHMHAHAGNARRRVPLPGALRDEAHGRRRPPRHLALWYGAGVTARLNGRLMDRRAYPSV